MPKDKPKSQMDLVREYFLARPNRDIAHEESKNDLEREWLKISGKRFEDSDRTIRKLKDEGFLIKVSKGVYRYDPSLATNLQHLDFDQSTKNKILERDSYKCVFCGQGRENGVDLHVDHIKPKSNGGSNNIDNGQTLCSAHNFLKKNFSQLELGKRVFLRMQQEFKVSGNLNNPGLESFVEEILSIYDKYNIDSHIKID